MTDQSQPDGDHIGEKISAAHDETAWIPSQSTRQILGVRHGSENVKEMKNKSTRRSMHFASCIAGALVQLFLLTTALAQPFKDPEVVAVPRTGTTQPLLDVTTSTSTPAPSPIPRRPQPGDKLGYSKEESTHLLDPEVRQLLDTLLRLYREPGLFADRRAAMAALGVEHYQRTWDVEGERSIGEPMHYVDRFSKDGIFARPGWFGQFMYLGWTGPKDEMWWAKLDIKIDRSQACIQSQAVEGYVDLFLQTGLDGHPHPAPANREDRHGFFGSPYALPLSPQTPRFSMLFASRCLVQIEIGNLFKILEISDEKARN